MTWPISMLFKIHDMTQYILCVEIYIINIGQCHNIFNVLYVVKSALNTVCVLYIYWNITQRDAGNQLYAFSMWVCYIFYGFVAPYSTKIFFFFSFFLFPSFLLACLFASLLAFFFSLPCFCSVSSVFLLAFLLAFFSTSLKQGKCRLKNKSRLCSFLLLTFLLAMPLTQVTPSHRQILLC